MSRVHDMGGRFGEGPVEPEAEAVMFKEDWHRGALALTVAAGGLGAWNLDMSRHARESLPVRDYATFSYYEKWLAGLINLAVAQGVLSREELTGDAPPEPVPPGARRVTAERVETALAKGGPADRPSDVNQRFSPGDRVRSLRPAANRLVDGGHTRLPGYASGAEGTVLRCHGSHVLPDANAHGLGERPEPLYAVAFPAGELWAAPEHPGDEVIVDLWQSYLEAAS